MKVLLKNGKIIDSSGKPSYQGSLVIENNDILDIIKGEAGESFDKIIDCTGLSIAPGFVDAHSHNDWFAARKDPVPYFKPFAEQGITTQITGNCGVSPFGYEAGTAYKSLTGGGMFTAGDASGDFSSFSGWREEAAKGAPLNLIPLLGYGTVRTGLAGYENRALTERETALRDAKIEEAFDQGVFGLSFGIMYEPERYSTRPELEEAAKIAAKRGGILTVHSRAFFRRIHIL